MVPTNTHERNILLTNALQVPKFRWDRAVEVTIAQIQVALVQNETGQE